MLQGPLEVSGSANRGQGRQLSGLQRRMAEACHEVTIGSIISRHVIDFVEKQNKAADL